METCQVEEVDCVKNLKKLQLLKDKVNSNIIIIECCILLMTEEQGYIFFKRPVFYSPDGRTLLLKLEISLSFDKKYFARKSLSFRNIFAILIRLNQKCLKT